MAAVGGQKKQVGRYEVGQTIGQGSFAKVKFVVDSDTGTAVAMKVLEKDTILSHRMLHQVSGGAPSSSPNFSVSLEANPNRVIFTHFQPPYAAPGAEGARESAAVRAGWKSGDWICTR
jgi:serine/threonine protein kinase